MQAQKGSNTSRIKDPYVLIKKAHIDESVHMLNVKPSQIKLKEGVRYKERAEDPDTSFVESARKS